MIPPSKAAKLARDVLFTMAGGVVIAETIFSPPTGTDIFMIVTGLSWGGIVAWLLLRDDDISYAGVALGTSNALCMASLGGGFAATLMSDPRKDVLLAIGGVFAGLALLAAILDAATKRE